MKQCAVCRASIFTEAQQTIEWQRPDAKSYNAKFKITSSHGYCSPECLRADIAVVTIQCDNPACTNEIQTFKARRTGAGVLRGVGCSNYCSEKCHADIIKQKCQDEADKNFERRKRRREEHPLAERGSKKRLVCCDACKHDIALVQCSQCEKTCCERSSKTCIECLIVYCNDCQHHLMFNDNICEECSKEDNSP